MNGVAPPERFDEIFAGPRPVIETERLLLRPFIESEGPTVERLGGDVEVAKTLLRMPYPYPDGEATRWIATHEQRWRDRIDLPLAIARRDDVHGLCGGVALHFDLEHFHAEVGYWIARAHWRRGIATEAVRGLLGWAFGTLGLHRVFAKHFADNAASGAVMRKAGMRYEGTLREHFWKHGRPHDSALYGILRGEWDAAGGSR